MHNDAAGYEEGKPKDALRDNSGLAEVYLTLLPYARDVAGRIAHDPDVIDDAVDTAFCRLFIRMQRGAVENPQVYLRREIHSAVRDYKSGKSREVYVGDGVKTLAGYVLAKDPNEEDVLEKIRDGVAKAIANTDLFSAEERRVIAGFVAGKTLDEITFEMGMEPELGRLDLIRIQHRLVEQVPEIARVYKTQAA